ncbi:MAG: BspA family leucine-rich repeat surface protein [Cyclobacteriaceae bacterium]|nr:BspA family leucine-rich repeat surface protein [Cyclobacteriaceae bacterium]
MRSLTRTFWLLITLVGIGFSSAAYSFTPKSNTENSSFFEDAGFPEFITTWETDNNEITIPTFSGETYNYDIAWTNLTNSGVGDGSTTAVTGDYTITGLTNGDIYQITISGNFPRIYFNNGGDKDKILTIENWGDQAWTSFANAFYGCSNLNVTDTEAPDLTNVIDLSGMFNACTTLNADFSVWDVTTINNMSRMFQDATSFNGDISTWDVSNVMDMSYLFSFASSFNGNLSTWRTGNVTTMRSMFGGATSFNQPIPFVAGIGYWDTSNVTNMTIMFSASDSFNQDISSWDVSKVTSFSGMFNSAIAFNQDISGWTINTTSSVYMNTMFANALAFNQPLDSWNVSNVVNMNAMFLNAPVFDQPLGSWNVGNVNDMGDMFRNCPFNQDISGWNVSNVQDFNGTFSSNTAFNQDISGWTIRNTTNLDMRNMFDGATSFDQDLGGWDVSRLRYAANMFNNSGLSIANYDNILIGWSAQTLLPNVSLGATGIYYCSAQTERDILTNATNNWFITDEGPGCIAVYEGVDTTGPEITNGQIIAYDFGSAQAGVGKTKSITLENRLSTTVTVDVAITGTAFSVTSPGLPVTIAIAPGTQTMDIFFNESIAGTYPEDISITSADFPGSFDFRLLGVITATAQPEIKVLEGSGTSGFSIADGDDTGFYVGEVLRGNDLITQFTIFNDGSASLDVTDINFTGLGSFSASPTSFTVAVGSFQVIDVTLDGSVSGFSSQTMNIVNNDADENPFDFRIEGTIQGPELVVIDGTNYYSDPHISNGQSEPLNLGTSTLGSSIVRQISFTNNGPVDLSVISMSISGTSFTHSAILPATVAAEVDGVFTYLTFDITLDGSVAGSFTETVTITSDDDSAPTYTFDITGDISDPNAPKVYWTDDFEINRSNLDGTAFEQYHTETTYKPRGIAIDKTNKIIYWTNEWGQIKKGSIGATGISGIVDFRNDGIDMARTLNGLTLDLTNNKLYYIDEFNKEIRMADLADPNPLAVPQTIVSGLDDLPYSIAVDPVNNKLYYTDNFNEGGGIDNTGALWVVDTDGSNNNSVYSTQIGGTNFFYYDVKLDLTNNIVYWSGANDDIYSPIGEIYYANISDISGTVNSFNTINSSPLGIDLDPANNKIYWTDQLVYMTAPKVARANLDGSNPEILRDGFDEGLNAPSFIALDVDASAVIALNILSHTPASNSQGIAANADIVLNFNSDIDPSTVNSSNIVVRGEQTGIISGTFSGGGTTTITFNPDTDFKAGETIHVTLTTGLSNTSASALTKSYSFSFGVVTSVAPESPAYFSQQTSVATAFGGAFAAYPVDMDNDGDIDVIGAAGSGDEIAWFENDGSQSFTKHSVATSIDGAKDVEATDMDNDGDIDIVSISTLDDRVLWFENDGSQNFTLRTISTVADGGFGIHTNDMDGDGDMDVLSASVFDNKIAWYENDGSQNFTLRIISTSATGALNVYSTDLDFDGDLDVLATAETISTVFWYENDGASSFTEHVLSTNFSQARDVYAIDLDGDLDMDVLTASEQDDKVAWFENDGSQSFTEHVITTAEDAANSVYAADMDGDGDIDVLSSGANSGEFTWYENDGSQNFTRTALVDVGNFAIESIPVDLDSDGDMDIIGTWSIGNEIVWFENTTGGCTDPATADAGVDQIICPTDAASLSATIGGSASGATWSTNGDGAFDDNTSLSAIYTPGTADLANGNVTLTLSTISATCPVVTDDVVVEINQPIVAVDQNGGTLKVGQTVNINTLNGATINSGDVITATVTANPQKGTVTVNTDGTISYTASQGQVGQDSFDFQICNQCNLCSSATASVTIENDAPTFTGTTTTTGPGVPVTINLLDLITDVNGNIDLSSIEIIQQPISGAKATLDANTNLIVDYTNIIFFGTDELVIRVCDFDGACTDATIQIEVEAQPIVAFNAVSPNGDGRHDFLEFKYIEGYPENVVKIFNRWGDLIFVQEGYNNQDKVFDGKANTGGNGELPSGTYYYTVTYKSVNNGSQIVKGFFELRR